LRDIPLMFADLRQVRITGQTVAITLALAMFIGAASAGWPAWTASRRSIVAALRFRE
jgi:hypothetical protein